MVVRTAEIHNSSNYNKPCDNRLRMDIVSFALCVQGEKLLWEKGAPLIVIFSDLARSRTYNYNNNVITTI